MVVANSPRSDRPILLAAFLSDQQGVLMTDLHGERIREMIEDLDDGHIEVKLDFIPVSERLPEPRVRGDDPGVAGLLYFPDDKEWMIEAGGDLGYHGAAKGWLFDWDTPVTEKYITSDVELTHWAEIPEIKEEAIS